MTEHPYDRVVHALWARGARVVAKRGRHDAVRATCPNHRDRDPSLAVKRDGDRVLLHCFGGCPVKKVVDALGLTMADLFSGPRTTSGPARIVAEYDYVDLAGVLIAQKVRLHPKTFRWRTPTANGGWRWGLYGAVVGLYRWADLIDARTVFLTEGERAADLLWSHRLPAACGPGGAGVWTSQFSQDLWITGCRELIVLADNDPAGKQHAERVATVTCDISCDAEPITVKLVHLQGLPHKGDVVDWLATRTVEELEYAAAQSQLWTPERAENDRLARQRELTRERVRRHRERHRLAASVTHRMSEAAPVTHRMSGGGPVTHRMSGGGPVTRNAVTHPYVLLKHYRDMSTEDPLRTGDPLSQYEELDPMRENHD